MDNGHAALVSQNIIAGATEIIKYEHLNVFLKGLYYKNSVSNVSVNGLGSLVLALLLLFQVFGDNFLMFYWCFRLWLQMMAVDGIGQMVHC